jgi:hypothetical protein
MRDDDDDDDDSTVTITGSSNLGGFSGSGISSLTAPSISTITVGGGGGGGVGAIGHTGTTGSYYVSTGTGVGTMWSTPTINSAAVLSTSKGNSVDLDELAEMMKIMKERLLILIPDFEKHEKYAALKKAYENYKMIEALIQEERKDD